MILRQVNGELILTNQIDHAEVSGVLASHWGNGAFGRPVHFDSVVFACAKHDEAWRAFDDEPTIDPDTAQPHSFMSMPLDLILPAYYDGAGRVGREDPYAGFLVSMHYQGFFNSRFGLDPALAIRTPKENETSRLAAYYSAMEQLRGRFRTIAGEQRIVFGHASSPVVAHAYLLLQVVDVISLFLCINPQGQWPLGEAYRTIGGQRVKFAMKPVGEGSVEVSPWPFAVDSIDIVFPVRRIPSRKYLSTQDVQSTIASAASDRLAYRISRAAS